MERNEPIVLGSGLRHNTEAQFGSAPIVSFDVVEGHDPVFGVREVHEFLGNQIYVHFALKFLTSLIVVTCICCLMGFSKHAL